MCGRFAIAAPAPVLITKFDLAESVELQQRYNVAPGGLIAVIRRSPEGKRVLHNLKWGLVPHWSKDPSIGMKLTNARGESLSEKPSFRDAYRRRRCLIPASGFYEWKRDGSNKQPYYFSLKNQEIMAMAGLWESWKAPDGSILRTACIITTEANSVMSPVHHRMPVIIDPEHWEVWLDQVSDVSSLLKPIDDDALVCWPVDKRVGRATEDDAGLIERQ